MFHRPTDLAITELLEASFPAIREECEALDADLLEPCTYHLNRGSWLLLPLLVCPMQKEFRTDPGQNRRRLPATAAVLDRVPGLQRAAVSVLGPHTHVAPHRDMVAGTFLRCHLGISIPEQCGMRIGGVVCHWREGQVIGFDGQLIHEVLNESDRPRVVLVADVLLTPEQAWKYLGREEGRPPRS